MLLRARPFEMNGIDTYSSAATCNCESDDFIASVSSSDLDVALLHKRQVQQGSLRANTPDTASATVIIQSVCSASARDARAGV